MWEMLAELIVWILFQPMISFPKSDMWRLAIAGDDPQDTT
jgi:hypothetical protein